MTTLKKAAQQELKNYMERIERLEQEKKEISDDIKSVYAEAKAQGFDVKALRSLIRLRKIEPTERAEQEALLDTYMHAVGLADEVPLFKSVGAMATDKMARDELIVAFKQLVPYAGEIIIKVGGSPIRLWRDDKGKARAEDYVEPETAPAEKTGKGLKKPATVLKMVPKEGDDGSVKSIADRAEERSKKQRERQDSEPEPEPV